MNATSMKAARTILEECNVMSIATCTDQLPWAASVFFVADDFLNLYFLSGKSSRHSQNIFGNPKAAATINKDYEDWFLITGLQIEGSVTITAEAERQRVLALYLTKFSKLARIRAKPANEQERVIVDRLMNSSFYRLQPHSIRLIDNREAFGFKENLEIPSEQAEKV